MASKQSRLWILSILSGALPFYTNGVQAQIIPDASLGSEGSIVTPNASATDLISGGARREGNLFHSFEKFSILRGRTAFFNNVTEIQNIFSRVTGNSISNIDGTIQANGNANFFLINPNGIVFGQNARLNLGGSFIASTANSINFADGTNFSAIPTQTTPLLTVSIPVGLQFGNNPGSISVQGNGRGLRNMEAPAVDTNNALRVQPNQTLALVGGNLTFEGGTLKTNGGRIELGSVSGNNTVNLIPINKGFALGYEGISNYGDIQLFRATSVDATGDEGGDIQVRGRRVTLQGGSQIEATTLRTASEGNLIITASELVELRGSTADNPQDNRQFPTSISTDNRENGQIPGELTINTRRLVVENGARISASNLAGGVGGNINVNAADSVELIGTGISPGGVRSSGFSVQTRGTGNAGNLRFNTRRLQVRDGAEISASTFGAGNGGNLDINATESLEISGTSANGNRASRLVAEVGNPEEIRRRGDTNPVFPATGKGGNLTINTRQLTVRNRGAVTVSSRSNDINAQGAGEIDVIADKIFLDNQGEISAGTLTGQGGNIKLQLQDLLLLRRNSRISTSAGKAGAGGNGGNITINTASIVAVPRENSDISANAFTGRGGNVTINTEGIFGIQSRPRPTEESDITASSERGINGVIEINSPDVDPTRGLIILPTGIVDASNLIASACEGFGGKESSEFTVTGRGGLPPSPDDFLSADIVWSDTPIAANIGRTGNVGRTDFIYQSMTPSQIIPATGWIFNDKGEVMLVGSASNAALLASGSPRVSCHQP